MEGVRVVVYELHPLLTDFLHDRATQYVSGDMTAPDRDAFEVLLEFNAELRAHVAGLREAAAAAAVVPVARSAPPARLRSRLLHALERTPREHGPDAMVVTTPAGLVEWVNPEFMAMCGHSLADLKGRKPGQLLQGPATDPATVARIRAAVRERRHCRETIVNYHKDGSTYRADVRISPVLDDAGEPLWFVARERVVES